MAYANWNGIILDRSAMYADDSQFLLGMKFPLAGYTYYSGTGIIKNFSGTMPEDNNMETYQGLRLTDRWYSVRLVDYSTKSIPRTAITFGMATVGYGFEGAAVETNMPVLVGDWSEQGGGDYWLRMGAVEFASYGKYTIRVSPVSAGNFADRSFVVEVLNPELVLDSNLPSHTVINSLGQRLQAIRANTALAGGPSTIQLDAGASAINDFYKGAIIAITGGLGINQARTITSYVGATQTATVQPNWGTNPNATSEYVIIPSGESVLSPLAIDNVWDELTSGHKVIDSFGQIMGNARANIATNGNFVSVTLDVGASAVDDFYNGNFIFITGGPGAGQTRVITAYNGVTKVATVQPDFEVTTGAGSEFVIVPTSSMPLAAIAAAILDADLQLHLGVPVGGRNIGNILGQLAQSEFELRTNVFATVAVPAQGITASMARKGVIQYQRVDMSYTKTWGAPDRTFYILYHYSAQQKQDIAKGSNGIVW